MKTFYVCVCVCVYFSFLLSDILTTSRLCWIRFLSHDFACNLIDHGTSGIVSPFPTNGLDQIWANPKKGIQSMFFTNFYCKCLSHIQLCNMQLPNKSERIWINLTFSFFIVIFPYSKNFRSIEICRFWRCQKLHTCHMDPISRNLKWR